MIPKNYSPIRDYDNDDIDDYKGLTAGEKELLAANSLSPAGVE